MVNGAMAKHDGNSPMSILLKSEISRSASGLLSPQGLAARVSSSHENQGFSGQQAGGMGVPMAMGLWDRPVSMHEFLTSRGFNSIIH